ncbi:hypothetical protein PR202_gb07757 [Eleusine coracana subsp. coracana]|uniref:RNase H type-1 domain-containing protein n=1 Tax=Eleusine coracana subsp. coracana TaxID=191504 RepID=A0AAV5EDW4_ELECO|nr:hypothetical protein PR202_gb07757 [Eleusine coracana subsp. coracana]
MEGTYKINCDGAFLQSTRRGGWGCIIRNHHGDFLAASAGGMEHTLNALHAEATACLEGLELAAKLGMHRVVVESDAVNLVKVITGSATDQSELAVLFSDIREKILYEFNCCTMSNCSRSCNLAADCLAACGLNSGVVDPSEWLGQAPEFVIPFVSGDLPGVGQ